MNVWLTIAVAGLLTFATRLSFIYLLGRMTAPPWFLRALRYVPVAVLSALIVPDTLTWHGAVNLSWRNPQIWAAAVAILVALRVKNVLVIIGAGMVALLLFQWLLASLPR